MVRGKKQRGHGEVPWAVAELEKKDQASSHQCGLPAIPEEGGRPREGPLDILSRSELR